MLLGGRNAQRRAVLELSQERARIATETEDERTLVVAANVRCLPWRVAVYLEGEDAVPGRGDAQAWTFHTGERPRVGSHGTGFEDTPVLADRKLLVCSPSDRVFALDPLTGRQEWMFDPEAPRRSQTCLGTVAHRVRGTEPPDTTGSPQRRIAP